MPVPFAIASGTTLGLFVSGSGVRALTRAQQVQAAAAQQQNALQQANYLSLFGNSLQNVSPRPPERRNDAGQTFQQWREGFDARLGMVAASGIPMSEREERDWLAQTAEWEKLNG